jgi:hypothetical protein
MRFGFIADELESVVPQVVRNVGNRNRADYEDQKAVVYQDLIALLVAASQSQTQKLDELSAQNEGQTLQLGELSAQNEGQALQLGELSAQNGEQTQKLDEATALIKDQAAKIAALEEAQAAKTAAVEEAAKIAQAAKIAADAQAAKSTQMDAQMAEVFAELQRMKKEGAHLATGVANATELANETDQNITNTTDFENASGDLNLTNATNANISDKTTQTRLRRP